MGWETRRGKKQGHTQPIGDIRRVLARDIVSDIICSTERNALSIANLLSISVSSFKLPVGPSICTTQRNSCM